MQIVTNPGSNLTARIVAEYAIEVTPQQISVDGVLHDTRAGIAQSTVDEWVRTAKEHPHVLGTSAAEFADIFHHVAQRDGEILAIQSSKKIIGSYTAAVSASRTLAAMPGHEKTTIAVVDTKSTDLGAALCTVLAGESARAGRTLAQTVETLEAFADQGVFAMTLGTLDNLVKGGRASFLRSWMANLLNVTPIISLQDGELGAVGRTSRSGDVVGAIVDFLVKKLGAGRSVWIGVGHGGVPDKASDLVAALERKLTVVHAEHREIQSSIYLHTGPGALGAFVYPIDHLPWKPPIPPRY